MSIDGGNDISAVVLTAVLDNIMEITINRPEARNALNGAVGAGLAASVTRAVADPDVLAVILTGAGERSFCAGMDLKAFSGGSDLSDVGAALAALRDCPKPIIGAVNGAALAGGFELLMLCDLVVAAEHATLGIPEVKRGLLAAGGATRLPSRIPLAIALELGLTGDPVDASGAARWGLVNRVVPLPELMTAARAMAARIVTNAPLAVQATKALMLGELGGGHPDAVRARAAVLFRSADAREGARAFAERRSAKWTGR
ncbi:enoyl-CoA hydratase-related protein [uncultured Jatrophihabitans sp.]|uniref:enoyl-CoA hydratase-related protein n=1 Tax=uncultured Jatrophihabitans sp. TaxID=1610747 RepID=UPI0035C9A7CC